ncbi:MAG: alanine racemase [Clostridia bacterium]|nr:alanine racemase [Clostridia bacterium]
MSALRHNFKTVKAYAGDSRIMAVVKADAYGHSVKDIAPILSEEGVASFAVSNLSEALSLREYGISEPILILGYTPTEAVDLLYKNDIMQCVYSAEYAKLLSSAAVKQGVEIKIHIKLDTGMGRIGFDCRSAELCGIDEAISAATLPNLKMRGIFTHFAVSDRTEKDEDGFTDEQYERYIKAIKSFEARGVDVGDCHCRNSAATLLDSDKRSDFCRPGIILYGLTPNPDLRLEGELIPVMSFKTVVTMVKEIKNGDTVSYGRTFKAENKMKIATLAAGYADGYPRSLSNKGYVLIKGKKAPIVGRVCMDQFSVDVSDIENVNIGDEVLLFGKELPVEVLAELTGTINYEIVTGISVRVPRFIKE